MDARTLTALRAETPAGDTMLAELEAQSPSTPTMGNLRRIRYRHEALIDLIIAHPEWDQNHYAAHFGLTPSWLSNIMASDAFQAAMAARREEIVDPELKATIEERFRALAIQSLQVLQKKLSAPNVSDNVALRAAELGAKALGIGGHAPAPPAPQPDRLERLAERLVLLQGRVRTAEVLDAEEIRG